MTDYAKVTRPERGAGSPEVKRYLSDLGRALEHVGIDYGEEFAVVPGDSIGSQASLDALGDQLGPFARDSETSRQAALDAFPRQHTLRWYVLLAVGKAPNGATRDELERILGLSGNTIRPRVAELVRGDFLVESDETRPTQNGSQAAVLKPTAKGAQEIKENHDARHQ